MSEPIDLDAIKAAASRAALLAEIERLRSLVVAHHFYGRALPLGRPCPVCVVDGCAHPEHDLSALVEGGGAGE